MTQKQVEKAHRRGKVGWDVGKHIEATPHYRRSHMASVATSRRHAILFRGIELSDWRYNRLFASI